MQVVVTGRAGLVLEAQLLVQRALRRTVLDFPGEIRITGSEIDWVGGGSRRKQEVGERARSIDLRAHTRADRGRRSGGGKAVRDVKVPAHEQARGNCGNAK